MINVSADNSALIFTCPVCDAGTELVETRLGGFNIYQCLICGHRFAPSAFDVSVDYDTVYDTEEYKISQQKDLERFINNPHLFARYIMYRPFFEQVKHQEGMRLLDVGRGVGRFCQAAHILGWDVTGIDVSDKAVAVAQQYAQFPVFRLGVDKVRQHGDRFDVVTAFEVLEHLSRPVEFLRLCRDVLTSRGQLFCTVPNWDCLPIQATTRIDWAPPIHLSFSHGHPYK